MLTTQLTEQLSNGFCLTDQSGRSISLFCAVELGLHELVTLLLDNGADVNWANEVRMRMVFVYSMF